MAKNKGKKRKTVNNSAESYIKNRARNLPIGDCYINESWKEKGFATIIISRDHVNGNFTFGVYLVDLYCLGVKDTFYDFNQYDKFIELVDKFNGNERMLEIDYTLAHNIIYGAVAFAEDLGFKPHKNFEIAQYLLEEDDERTELIDVEFGLNGKPAIFKWKEAHPANIIATLERNVGNGNFTVFSGREIDEEEENDWDDEDDNYEDDNYEDDDLQEDDEDEDYEPLTTEDDAISDGKKKTTLPELAMITFSVFKNVCTKEEQEEMYEIIEKVESWKIVDEDQTDVPLFMNEETKLAYQSQYPKTIRDPENAIAEIESLIAEQPDEYQFHLLLSIAYETLEDEEKEFQNIAATYSKFPHKILAFTNYVLSLKKLEKHDELKKLIGDEFDFHKHFPQRQNLSFEELIALTGTLFLYFFESLKQPHKAIAFAMPLCSFIFYGDNKTKAYQFLRLSNKLMFLEIDRRKEFDDTPIEEFYKKSL